MSSQSAVKRKPRSSVSVAEMKESLERLQALNAELIKRKAKEGNLVAYAQYVMRTDDGEAMIPANHHEVWLDALENTTGNLLIISPPSHAKSTYFSICYPSDYIGKHPEHSIILISNTATQAEKFHGSIKTILEKSMEYKEIYPNVEPDFSRGWNNSELFIKRKNINKPDPTLFSTGIGGPVIGRRANLIIVDDPTSQADAKSDTVRTYQKDWVRQTLMSRLLPTGRMIVIMTRWHDDDIAKMLMQPEFGFKVMFFPAIWDKECVASLQRLKLPTEDVLGRNLGDPLWPEERPIEWLLQEKKKLGKITFSCMYQGDTSGMGGELWKSSNMRYWSDDPVYIGQEVNGVVVREKPQHTLRFQAVDLNVTSDNQSDYFVVATGSIDYQLNLYLEDIYRKQLDSSLHKMAVQINYGKFSVPPVAVGIEAVAYQSTFVTRIINETMIPAVPLRPEGDKYTRALGAVIQYENGKVYHKIGAEWQDDLEAELISFPRGSNDDQVDGVVYLILLSVEYMLRLLASLQGEDELTLDERVSIGSGNY